MTYKTFLTLCVALTIFTWGTMILAAYLPHRETQHPDVEQCIKTGGVPTLAGGGYLDKCLYK